MKSKSMYLAGLTGIGLLSGLVAAACGDSGTGSGGAGTGTGTSVTGTSVTSTATHGVTSSTGSGTGGAPDGNDTIDTATPLTPGTNGSVQTDTTTLPTLDPPATDVDFYSFTAAAGPWYFTAIGQPSGKEFTAGFLDTVITVYDSNKQPIAQNDDPFPRSSQNGTVQTILPTAGTYYVKVEEFCESALATTPCPADYFMSITDNTYTFFGTPIATDAADKPEAEPNDSQATATAIPYGATTTAGTYYLSNVWGTLNSPATDAADWYSFTIPSDVTVTAGSRLSGSFTVPPPSTKGNGSNINPGKVQVIDGMSMTLVGELDFSAAPYNAVDSSRPEISLPLQTSHPYFLKVNYGTAAADGAGNFYFVSHGIGGGNPLELEATGTLGDNDTTPEVLTGSAVSSGGKGFFVEGDLPVPGALGLPIDIDTFSAVVGSATTMTIACGAQDQGSGLRGLTVTAKNAANGTTIATDTETATHIIDIGNTAAVSVSGITTVNVTISGDAALTAGSGMSSHSYRCGIYMNP